MGLMDYHARFYSPYLNRFIQPDSLIPNPGNPQTFNRFAYVLNSPLNFTDPSGHICIEDDINGKPVKANCKTGEIIGKGGGGGNSSSGSNEDSGKSGGGDSDLEDNLGLNKDSDLACTIYSCTENVPGVCPLGETCYIQPNSWDLDPLNADYHTVALNIMFVVLQLTRDRYARTFFSVGASNSVFGIAWISGSPGALFDGKIATQSELDSILIGPSINLTGSEFGGIGDTFSPGSFISNSILGTDSPTNALEGGLHLTYPGITVTGLWGFLLH